MEYLKQGNRTASQEKGLDLAGKPLTPRSERPRKTWGSMEISLQVSEGLCKIGRKCVRKNGHDKGCWPSDSA